MTEQSNPVVPLSPVKLIIWAAISLLVSGVLLVSVVLPAEYGIDPLRTGEILGIYGMSRTSVFDPGDPQARMDDHEMLIRLQPFEAIEIKYEINDGASILYEWEGTGELLYELHSHPVDAPEGFADSYDRERALRRTGMYTAPYTGLHGWYWENRSVYEVLLTVHVSGFFDCAFEYSGNVVRELVSC